MTATTQPVPTAAYTNNGTGHTVHAVLVTFGDNPATSYVNGSGTALKASDGVSYTVPADLFATVQPTTDFYLVSNDDGTSTVVLKADFESGYSAAATGTGNTGTQGNNPNSNNGNNGNYPGNTGTGNGYQAGNGNNGYSNHGYGNGSLPVIVVILVQNVLDLLQSAFSQGGRTDGQHGNGQSGNRFSGTGLPQAHEWQAPNHTGGVYGNNGNHGNHGNHGNYSGNNYPGNNGNPAASQGVNGGYANQGFANNGFTNQAGGFYGNYGHNANNGNYGYPGNNGNHPTYDNRTHDQSWNPRNGVSPQPRDANGNVIPTPVR